MKLFGNVKKGVVLASVQVVFFFILDLFVEFLAFNNWNMSPSIAPWATSCFIEQKVIL